MTPRCKFIHNLSCEQVSDRITELEDDNAKLRTQLADATESMGRVEERCAELRKLISELYACSQQCGCDRCGYRDGCTMLDRMRGLGIEVGE